jgi:Na+/melibiose symporter-like transporter
VTDRRGVHGFDLDPWAGYNGALKRAGRPQAPDVLDRMQHAASVLPALLFLVAILVMATYPLTGARFKEIVEAIRAP